MDTITQDAIDKAIQSKTETLNKQISEMESAMATLNERHTLAMDIIADKSNTIRILNEEVGHLERSRNYWRDRSHVFARRFHEAFTRLGDFETWLGLKFRNDVWDYSKVEDFSQQD
jgi:chromosome segregation ATPase